MFEIPLAGASYDLKPATTQRSVNVEPIVLEAQGITKFRMKQTPGLTSFATVTGAPRGARVMGDWLYVVQGAYLYRVNSGGVETQLGAIAGTNRVSMANNGRYMVVVNGTEGYYYDSTDAVFAQITDADFLAADVVEYIDGYFIFHATDSDNAFISSLNDPTTYDATDIQAKGGSSDLMVGLIAINGGIVIFGATHSYYWRNTGNVDFPFENIDGAEMQRGCPSAQTLAGIDNSVIFLGDDLVVYWIEGYVPKRISNNALEEFISGLTEAQIAAAYGFAYTQSGQYYYALTVGGRTWVYNRTQSLVIQQSLWHERSSNDGIWRAQTYAYAFGKHLVGDDDTIWELDADAYLEGTDSIRRTRRLAPLWAEDEVFSVGKLRLMVRVGTGTLTVAPLIDLRTSTDGGYTWTDPRSRSMGLLGDYSKTVIWRRLGRTDNKIFEFSWTSDADVELFGLYADVA